MNNDKKNISRLTAVVCLGLVIAQVVVFFGSWVWSAAMPESSVRSMLSNGGIRWLFGTFVANLASPLLVWLIILDIGWGICCESGFISALKLRFSIWRRALDSQRKSGLRAVGGLLLVEIAVVLLLTLPPHAVLLSVTGRLFPSSFSVSIVPIIAFMAITSSVCYGMFSGNFHNYKDVVRCACHGGQSLKTLLIIYVLAVELYYSVVYVMG